MAKVRGKLDVDRYFRDLPAKLDKVLQGAARAGGKALADEARSQTDSATIRKGITVKQAKDRPAVTITVKGRWAYSLAGWHEYGTDRHAIIVETKRSLKIGDRFVGPKVIHPGSQPKPFLRPALDIGAGAANAAAQKYINSRIVGRDVVPKASSGGSSA